MFENKQEARTTKIQTKIKNLIYFDRFTVAPTAVTVANSAEPALKLTTTPRPTLKPNYCPLILYYY